MLAHEPTDPNHQAPPPHEVPPPDPVVDPPPEEVPAIPGEENGGG